MTSVDEIMQSIKTEYFANGQSREFVPYAEKCEAADALTVYFKGDADYSKRLTDHVTLYLSLDTDEIVGCRIKGIKGILEDLPNFVQIDHGETQLRFVFLSLRGASPNDEARRAFNNLAKNAGNLEVSVTA